MFYRCFTCNKIGIIRKDTYQVSIRSEISEDLNKYLCNKCGDEVADQYEVNKMIAESENNIRYDE